MSFFISNEIIFALTLGGIVFTLSYLWSDRILEFLQTKSLGQREEITRKLELMYVEVNQRQLTIAMLLSSFGIGFVFFLLLWPNFGVGIVISCVVTVVGWSAPALIVNHLFEKRCNRFVDQMVDAVTILANGVSSGLSVAQAMERVVDNMDPPISQEFRRVLSEVLLGRSLEEALNSLGERIPNKDVQMFVTSINILKETGGNLAETFSTIVETIRERQKIEKKIEALTAQGMMQGTIITMIPFVLLGVFMAVDPGYVKPLFTTTLGIVFLLIMLALQIIGGFAIRRVVKIKI